MRHLLLVVIGLVLSNAAWAQEKANKPILVLNAGGHTSTVNKLFFTPDGKELITVSDDKTIRTWDTATGEALRVLRPPVGSGFAGRLTAAALSPDGKTLAVAAVADKFPIYLIALARGTLERTLTGHKDTIWHLAFSPDGKLLASASADKTARLWKVATGVCEQTLDAHKDVVSSIAFSPDGQQLATASADKSARIWSVKTGESVAELEGHTEPLWCVAWSPDGKTIATGGEDKSIRLWDTKGKERKSFTDLGNTISSVTFSAKSKQLLLTRYGGGSPPFVCTLLDLETGKPLVQFKLHNDDVRDSALSPDGTVAATTGGRNQGSYLWKIADATVVARLVGKGHGIYSAAWSKDGDAIGWGNTEAEDSTKLSDPLEHSFSLSNLGLGPAPDKTFRRAQLRSGSLSLTSKGESTVTVKRDGKKTASLELSKGDNANCFTLLPDDLAVVGSNECNLYCFNTRTGKQLHSVEAHVDSIFAVAPSPDNRYLLTAAGDQTLRIWTVAKDRFAPLLSLFFAGTEWVAWTPEGYYAASPGGEDLMGWHRNQGRDKMARFYSASQFRESLYRPDVIKLLLETGSVDRALEEADKVRGKKSEHQSVAKVLPPFVEITTPDKPNIDTKEPTLEVRFFARPEGTQPITEARLLVNGRPYPGDKGIKTFDPPRDGTVRESWTVQLAPGANTFTVEVRTAVSEGLSEPVTVNLLGARGLTKIDPTPEERKELLPNLYVLAVGVSDYNDKTLKLNYAGKDAKAITATFEKYSKDLYKKIDVKVLTDKEATRRNILVALQSMRKSLAPNDVGVFFFAGHGDKDSQGRFFLLPVDVDRDNLVVSAVQGSDVTTSLAGAHRVIVMLDACHSGAVNVAQQPIALTDDLARNLQHDYGIIVMCSSRGREDSLESSTEQHGFFTLAAVEGLTGKAKNFKGLVGVADLNAFIPVRVEELSNNKQSPVCSSPLTVRTFALTKP